jgi:hypothetical protein
MEQGIGVGWAVAEKKESADDENIETGRRDVVVLRFDRAGLRL